MTVDVPVRAPVLPETVTPLKPSEALRLGRLTRPDGITGAFFGGPREACALGAMAEAVGIGPGPTGDDPYVELSEALPELDGPAVCPTPFDSSCVYAHDVAEIVYHLNDSTHLWSDDQIVEWLESLGL